MKRLIAAFFILFSVSAAQAATLNFNFTLTDGTDVVSGIISGLTDNSTGPASDVTITASHISGTLGSYLNCLNCFVFDNRFTVSAGILTGAAFDSVFFNQRKLLLVDDEGSLFAGNTSTLFGQVTYQPQPIPPVPLPASGLLVVSSAICLAVLRRRRTNRQPG